MVIERGRHHPSSTMVMTLWAPEVVRVNAQLEEARRFILESGPIRPAKFVAPERPSATTRNLAARTVWA